MKIRLSDFVYGGNRALRRVFRLKIGMCSGPHLSAFQPTVHFLKQAFLIQMVVNSSDRKLSVVKSCGFMGVL